MNDARPAGSSRSLAVVGILTFVAVAATIGVSFLLAPSPRSFTANVATSFLCLVETTIGLLIVGSTARARGAGSGGASSAVLLGVTVIYAVSGFVAIGAYAMSGRRAGHEAWLWAALLVETAAAFIVAGAFWGGADAMARAEAPALARRAEHASLARQVREAGARLRGVATREPAEMKKLDALMKRLDAIETSLARSHGGGVGSREGGGSPASDPSVEQDLADAAQSLASDAASIAPGADLGPALDRLAARADRLRSAVDRLS